MPVNIYNLENPLQEVGSAVVPSDWTTTAEKFIAGSSNYKITWTKDGEEKGYLIVEPDTFANTMYLIDFFVHEPNNQVFKNLCIEMPPYIRSIGITTFSVPMATTPASQYILSEAGFIQGEDGFWRADVSEEDNSVETYGKLR